MLLYNTSFQVIGEKTAGLFVSHVQGTLYPEILSGGMVRNIRFCRVLAHTEEDVFVYSLMFDIEGLKELKAWKEKVESKILKGLKKEFGDRVLTFSSTMKEYNLKEENLAPKNDNNCKTSYN